MKQICFIVAIVVPLVITDFDCHENKIASDTCTTELNCLFQEEYQEREGFSKYCRCRTVINDLPLPDNALKYSMFRNICSQKENQLQQLWVVDAEVEYIDNDIFRKYQNLKYLNLAGNKLMLNFSETAWRLTELDVSNNGLNSIRRDAFKYLQSLKMVNISFNRLDQVNFCFQTLNNLEEIHLNNNYLKKISRNDFDHLQKLRVLNLAHNQLAVIDSNLFLFSLEELHLNNNYLSTITKQNIIRLPKLKILKIGDNFISRLESISSCGNLEELHCENNQVDNLTNVISQLPKLTIVKMPNNRVQYIKNDTFSSTNNLTVVDFSSNGLADMDPNSFQHFKNVSIFNFSNNSLTEKVINCENVQKMKQVKVIDLSFNDIAVLYSCTFRNLANLTKLSLVANKLEKLPVSAFSALNKLEELNLAANKIVDIPVGIFDDLKELTSLNISHNSLTKFELDSLNNNPKITSFDIRNNAVKDLNLTALKEKLPEMRVMNIDDSLIKCGEYSSTLEYFEDFGVLVGSCGNKTECCVNGNFSKAMIMIVAMSIVCFLAIVGLLTIFCRCFRLGNRQSTIHTIQLVPILPKPAYS